MSLFQQKAPNYSRLVLSICITFAFLELFCRLALPRPGFTALSAYWLPGAIRSHPTRLYQFRPNYSAVFTNTNYGEMAVTTNSIGLRERPLKELQQSKIRILAVGDSFTFGTGIRREDAWPAQVERALRDQLPWASSPVTVINAGIPGYGMAQIRDLTAELLTEFSPQIVILGVSANGFDRLIDPTRKWTNSSFEPPKFKEFEKSKVEYCIRLAGVLLLLRSICGWSNTLSLVH